MRLWSVHPRYLDSKGLVALWREGLLAQSVLRGKTTGYRHHPQLVRFKQTDDPSLHLANYLLLVAEEATARGYCFDVSKISPTRLRVLKAMPVTQGQLRYEANHLLKKLRTRDPERFRRLSTQKTFCPHPIFFKERGPVEDWEKVR